ncbi:MAG: DUF1385 domain-containing protein [Dehalococcoidia bacterium]|nr:MAG: DUF1385 domain-containing protein [Dehalococcoidia bacterium]
MAQRFYYGGQAVIEGVMMRGQKAVVTAVRQSDGEVVIDTRPLPSISTSRMRRIPLIRGVVALIEAMYLGVKSLLYSANVSMEEEGEKLPGGLAWGMVAGSLAFAVAFFFIAPLFLTRLLDPYIQSSIIFHLIEGFIRLGFFIAYLRLITLARDIRRVFAYHGAEHKAVNAYEAGVPLEVEAVKKYSTAHVRCGTSFLFAVLIIAIIVFAIIGRPSVWVMVLSRIALVPLIAALGYEVTYFGARHNKNRLVRAFLAPGLWLQELTTREPDDNQLEVALSALKKVVEVDHVEEVAQASS